jgi:hypothetical protein
MIIYHGACVSCQITEATNTHSEYIILIAFPRNNVFANAPQCYVYTYIACRVSFKDVAANMLLCFLWSHPLYTPADAVLTLAVTPGQEFNNQYFKLQA